MHSSTLNLYIPLTPSIIVGLFSECGSGPKCVYIPSGTCSPDHDLNMARRRCVALRRAMQILLFDAAAIELWKSHCRQIKLVSTNSHSALEALHTCG